MKKLTAILMALLLMSFSFAAVAEQPTLTMATNASFPPYEYWEETAEGQKIVGIDAEIAEAIAAKLGYELVIEDMEFGSIITSVQQGRADFGMAGMTVTSDRLLSVNFSDSYATGIQAIIVKEGSDITGPDTLEGKKIGVQTNTTGHIYAEEEFGIDNVMPYANGALAVSALVAGKIDCVIIDNEPAKAYVAANEGLVVLDSSYAVEEYAICFNKENTELLDEVNAALKELIEDGTVKAIVDKYINAAE